MPKELGSAPFDDDGMATRRKHLVRDGVLQSYVLSAYSARKTEHGAHGQCRRRA